MTQIMDGLRNLVANMGTSRAKAGQAEYVRNQTNREQLWTAYQASKLVQRAIDLPAEDACREWREWQAEADAISKIEAEEARLGLQIKTLEGCRLARIYGGAAIFIVTNDKDLSEPLEPERVQAGGIKYLTLLADSDLAAGEVEMDPREPYFGQPKHWMLSTGGVLSPEVHPSRLVLFHGVRPLGDRRSTSTSGWGESDLSGMLDALKRVDEVAVNILALVYEAKVDVVKVPDLMQKLAQHGGTYEQQLLDRLSLAMTAKGLNGTLILDALEEYEQKSASFGGLPDITDRMMQLASAATGVPMTLLFGTSPGGLNATGDSDIRNYYDRVKVHQTLQMQPSMSVLDECLIRSALGDRPDEVFYHWRPLWQPTSKERADTGKVIADTFKIIADMDVLPIEAVGNAIVNGLTESGLAPGLEADAAEFGGAGDKDDLDDDGLDIDDDLNANDASPRTLYVRRDVLNGDEIIAWAKQQGFKITLPADDLHVTLMFSRRPVDWMKMGESWQSELEISAGGARMMEQFGDARVLLFSSSEMSWRHEQMKREGATWDHAEYQPHITISYDPDAPDLADIEPYRGEIKLGPEIFEEVNEKWLEGISEE